jgi:hypothetical protein
VEPTARVASGPIAHTNVAWYGQLVDRGWSDADLGRARAAYDLAAVLFSGRLRPDGNTFIAHVLGVASTAAAYGAAPDVVLAGLLHAAYTVGEFGDVWRVVHDGQRRTVRDAIGDRAETLVHEFATLQWAPDTVAALRARTDELDPTERDVVFLRLVNEVEQRLDASERYRQPRLGYPTMDDMIALAEEMDLPEVAEDLRALAKQEAAATIPAAFVRTFEDPTRVAPRSHRPRFLLACARLVCGAGRRLGRLARRRGA